MSVSRNLGADKSIELKVRGDLAAQIVELYGAEDEGFLFLCDPKRHTAMENLKKLAPTDASMLRILGKAWFETSEEKCLFRPDKDFARMFDARSSKGAGLIAKHVLKVGASSKVLPARAAVPLRLMHHNREFGSRGWARARKNRTDPWLSVEDGFGFCCARHPAVQ